MSDWTIQERLRKPFPPEPERGPEYCMRLIKERQEAANVIDGLVADRRRLRGALKDIKDSSVMDHADPGLHKEDHVWRLDEINQTARTALAAVQGNTEGES